MREVSKPTKGRILIVVERRDGYWETDVFLNDEHVGAGTSSHALGVAGDILYGDTNDYLNGSQGLLIDRGYEKP